MKMVQKSIFLLAILFLFIISHADDPRLNLENVGWKLATGLVCPFIMHIGSSYLFNPKDTNQIEKKVIAITENSICGTLLLGWIGYEMLKDSSNDKKSPQNLPMPTKNTSSIINGANTKMVNNSELNKQLDDYDRNTGLLLGKIIFTKEQSSCHKEPYKSTDACKELKENFAQLRQNAKKSYILRTTPESNDIIQKLNNLKQESKCSDHNPQTIENCKEIEKILQEMHQVKKPFEI